MKKIITLIVINTLLSTMAVQSQIKNSGFENFNADSTVSNWGNSFPISIGIIDSTGHYYGDSIVIDNYYFFPTTDANSGITAMEMRNAWNFTSGQGTAGGILSTSDSVFSSYASFAPVPFPFQPSYFNFYFKYFPVNDDSAYAQFEVFDSIHDKIGEAFVIISGTVNNYTMSSTPVIYSSPGSVAFYKLKFSTFFTMSGSAQPSLGTRFLIDDISTELVTGINLIEDKQLTVYPNPANSEINISTDNNLNYDIILTDLQGKVIYKNANDKRINISQFPSGIYFLKLISGNTFTVKKIVKNN